MSPLALLIIFAAIILVLAGIALGGWIYIFSILFKLKRLCREGSGESPS